MLPVDKSVDECAAFLAVKKPAVDEDSFDRLHYSIRSCLKQILTVDVDVQVVCIPAHLSVSHR